MWTQWVYVQKPGQELEFMQLVPEQAYVPGPGVLRRIWRLYKLLKSLPLY